jgi:hypothetical protein
MPKPTQHFINISTSSLSQPEKVKGEGFHHNAALQAIFFQLDAYGMAVEEHSLWLDYPTKHLYEFSPNQTRGLPNQNKATPKASGETKNARYLDSRGWNG